MPLPFLLPASFLTDNNNNIPSLSTRVRAWETDTHSHTRIQSSGSKLAEEEEEEMEEDVMCVVDNPGAEIVAVGNGLVSGRGPFLSAGWTDGRSGGVGFRA